MGANYYTEIRIQEPNISGANYSEHALDIRAVAAMASDDDDGNDEAHGAEHFSNSSSGGDGER